MKKLFDTAYVHRGFQDVIEQMFGALDEAIGGVFPSTPYEFKDKGDVYQLNLGVPGFKKNEVTVEEKEKHLYVTAKNAERSKAAVIPLLSYDYQDITAKVEDGLLTITLSKKTAEKLRKIDVK